VVEWFDVFHGKRRTEEMSAREAEAEALRRARYGR
jgi:hypothetical protein